MSGNRIDDGDSDQFRKFFGPDDIDRAVRMTIQVCFLYLPKTKRTPEELERQIHRLVDRALREFREDQQAFADHESA